MTILRNDWHPAQVIVVLRMNGMTMAAVSREVG